MKTVIVTGSAGLVGSSAVRKFAGLGYRVVGIDNDSRGQFFGEHGSVATWAAVVQNRIPGYLACNFDIRERYRVDDVIANGGDIQAVIHCAAQPSHDWAAKEPRTDFEVNAVGTQNLIEATRRHCPQAAFIFMSTNKVYGDRPNVLPMVESRSDLRWNPYDNGTTQWLSRNGISESCPIDDCTHSLFGASKLAADILVQEYARYFSMNTVCFRAGCITGPAHAGVPQHGFLAYLVKCCMTGTPYEIIGYGGKQVRDNIHADDLASAFVEYLNAPTPGAVYNIGGGPDRSCSVLEAIALVERISGRKMQTSYVDEPRKGDHKWWISDCRKFQRQYPEWRQEYTLERTIEEIVHAHAKSEAA